jgi:hypothetical protein
VPTIFGMHLPLPKDWQEFEQITRDAMSLKWESPNLQKNGRPGQKQKGVDIYGLDYLGRPVGIQCKRYKGALELKTVKDEIKNAAEFDGKLTALYVATTADHDSKLQEAVRKISEARAAAAKFAVGILFWEDIFSGLSLNHTVLQNHYPQLKFPHPDTDHPQQPHLAALVIGYYGCFLWDYIELVFGEFGWMAQEDPYQIQGILHVIQQNTGFINPIDAEQISKWTTEIDSALFVETVDTLEKRWPAIKEIATRVQNRVRLLTIPDLVTARFLDLGKTLGALNFSDGEFNDDYAGDLFAKVIKLLPHCEARVIPRISKLKGKPGYSAAPALLTFLDSEIRWR